MMRTSGGGGRDVFMLSVPLSILLFFVVTMTGGPTAVVRLLERHFASFAEWVMTLFALAVRL